MEQQTNELIPVEEKEEIVTKGFVEELQGGGTNYYCSIVNDGKRDTQIAIYNAINNCDTPLVSAVNLVLEVVDIAAYNVELYDEESNTISDGIRVILVCKDGTTYFATSQGVLNSLRKIFAIVGLPDNGAWHKNPLKLKAIQKSTRRSAVNKVTILEMVK